MLIHSILNISDKCIYYALFLIYPFIWLLCRVIVFFVYSMFHTGYNISIDWYFHCLLYFYLIVLLSLVLLCVFCYADVNKVNNKQVYHLKCRCKQSYHIGYTSSHFVCLFIYLLQSLHEITLFYFWFFVFVFINNQCAVKWNSVAKRIKLILFFFSKTRRKKTIKYQNNT